MERGPLRRPADGFRCFYEEHHRFVHGVAVRLVGSAMADEVTQEVFLLLWLQPHLYDAGRGSARAFLRIVAERRALDVLRRHQRSAAREMGDLRRTSRLAECDDLVEASVMATERDDRVRRALDRLTTRQHEIIEVTYFEGLSLRQAASRLGIPEGTAKSRMRHALSGLRSALDEIDG